MKKNFIKVIFVLILILSLGLNIALLYEKTDKTTKITKNDVTEDEVTVNNINYTKESLGSLFKDYQSNSKLAKSDDIVIWEVTKITEVGYFKSDKNKKLYYIEEKYSCIEGTDCISTVGEVKVDDEYNNKTTFVVSVSPVDKNTAVFEILDYSIEKDKDFVSTKHTELK